MSYSFSEINILLRRLTGLVPESIIDDLPTVWMHAPMQKNLYFDPNLSHRLAHFLSQCAHESDGFQHRYEQLKYSAEQLQKMFIKYFPTPEIAKEYAHQPAKIASRVYANRMGNGDEESQDGYRYRGRGYLQLTGKDNYRHFDHFLKTPRMKRVLRDQRHPGTQDCLHHPDLVATEYPLMSAYFFFYTHAIWPMCDEGTDHGTAKKITQLINGGFNGLAKRYWLLQKFSQALNDETGIQS